MLLKQLQKLLAALMALLGDEKVKMMLEDPRIRLFSQAQKCLNQILSPEEKELGCAITVNRIHKKEFGKQIGGDYSTTKLYMALKNDKTFMRVSEPMAGDVIISPTGYGNGKIRNGHTGICGLNGSVMSNTSLNGRFTSNYTLSSWKERYGDLGGFPILFFRKISS